MEMQPGRVEMRSERANHLPKLRWSLLAGIARSSATLLRPNKGTILKRFSTPYIKPFRGHCAVQNASK